MKIKRELYNAENNIRSIFLGNGHFLFSLKKKSTSPTWSYFDTKNNNGITLIALIITIIIMLILAGVVISLTLGENGLFSTAKYAVTKTEEEKAREKLELALVDLQAKKYTDIENYDENDYINDYLSKEGMIVIGDIVIVDGWTFSIDRSVPKIGESLGKGGQSKKIEIGTNIENAVDYTSATIKIEIEYEGTLKEIKINGQEQEIPEKNEEGKYAISKEVTTNGKYTIYVKDENDEYKTDVVEVTEISEDMDIKNADDLVWFCDRVNKGATYEERTITVVNDIDLSKVCYKVDGTVENDKSWEPIGNYGTDTNHIFKGTFNGNYHKIQGLYINSNKDYQGLFGRIENATIIGVVIEQNSSITGKSFVGSIAGWSTGTTKRCVNYAKVNSVISSSLYVGGILGRNNGVVEECYNIANVQSNGYVVGGFCGGNYGGTIKNSYSIGNVNSLGHDQSSHSQTGGFSGNNVMNATIENVYHIGEVSAKYTYVGGIVGYNGNSSSGKQIVKNVFNVGTVKYGSKVASSNIGSGLGTLIGRYQTLSGKYGNITEDTIKGWDEETIKTNLGDNFTKDINNINNGYPILKWQIEKK